MRPKVIRARRAEEARAARSIIEEVIRRGGLIIYPTDTVYGLGANPLDVDAVRRVYQAKRRGAKALPVLGASIDDVRRIAVLDEAALRLAERFWPGPLTLIVPRRDTLPDLVTAGSPSVGVRIPDHEVAIEVIKAAGGLLIGTSANISGHPPPRTAEEAMRELGDAVDLVVDAGPCPLGMPSTVVDLTSRPPRIIRQGPISKTAIEEVLGECAR